MTEPPSEEHVRKRAELLPEEQAVGSDLPQEQARAILAESEDRVLNPEKTRDESSQVPD